MPSIFDPEVPRDVYLEHMVRTLDWVRQQKDEHRNEPTRKGYYLAITVEAQWLEQLIAECLAKHQMLMECQRQLGLAAQAAGWDRRIVPPSTGGPNAG